MAGLKTIRYGRTFVTAPYESEHIEFEEQFPLGKDDAECVQELRERILQCRSVPEPTQRTTQRPQQRRSEQNQFFAWAKDHRQLSGSAACEALGVASWPEWVAKGGDLASAQQEINTKT